MPLDILLVAVSQRGTSSRRRTLRTLAGTCDTEGELVRLAATSGRPLLAKIDPYGGLVLTPSEVDQLVAELRSLDGAARGTARRAWSGPQIVGTTPLPALLDPTPLRR